MNWVESGGGPLIVIPAEIASHWRGVEGARRLPKGRGRSRVEIDFAGSDYGRACDVVGYVGTLEVGPGRAMILGDDILRATFVPNREGGVLVRWMWAEHQNDVQRAVQSIPETIWKPSSCSMVIAREGALLFDSVYPGDDLPTEPIGGDVPWLRLELPPGEFQVETADYEPDETTRLILHRLKKKRGSA